MNKYRYDIGALRAIAVISVIMYHFGARGFKGGFSGVDIFFVISGFLMTSIIFKGIDNNNFSLLSFYLSRARRIIPSLIVVCLFVTAFGWFNLTTFEYKSLSLHAISSVIFLSNFIYLRESSYFDPSSGDKWLLHTWSLSVEWQFYLIYPLIIIFLIKLIGEKGAKIALLLTGLISLAICVLGIKGKQEVAFFMLPWRAWEMLAGGYIAIFAIKFQNNKLKSLMTYAGLALIVASVHFINESDLWPGVLTVIPVLGTMMVIASCSENTILFKSKVIQYIAKISYSAYLWHWPVVVWLKYNDMFNSVLSIMLSMSFIFIVSSISTFLFESRSQRLLGLKKKNIQVFIFSLILILVCSPLSAIYVSGGFKSNLRTASLSDKSKFIDNSLAIKENLYDAYMLKCDFYDNSKNIKRDRIEKECYSNENENNVNVFLWGDSHAQAISMGLRNNLPEGYGFFQVATSDCRPFIGKSIRKSRVDNNCDKSNELALMAIKRLKPDYVIIEQEADHDKTDWGYIANALKEYGVKNLIVLGPLPQYKPSLPSLYVKHAWGKTHISESYLDRVAISTDNNMKTSGHDNYRYISVIDNLCQNNECYVSNGDGSIFAFDYGHLTPSGSNVVGKLLSKDIFKK